MALNREIISPNNRKRTRGRIKQVVYSEPQKIFKKKYITPKGLKLVAQGVLTEKEAWEKYGKNRYINNPNAKPIRIIHHIV